MDPCMSLQEEPLMDLGTLTVTRVLGYFLLLTVNTATINSVSYLEHKHIRII